MNLNRYALPQICTLLLSVLFLASCQAQTTTEPSFYLGLDLSYVNEVEACGAVYHVDGEQQDPFQLFQEQGANLVRARLWHNPDWTLFLV